MSNQKQHYYSNPVHATEDIFKNHPYNTCRDPFGNPLGCEGNAIWQIVVPEHYDDYTANPEDEEVAARLVNDIDRAIESLGLLRCAVIDFTYKLNNDGESVFSPVFSKPE
tara:strand:+ start:4542 stop:4871 length:330 start_codon:yes stop_codon:yes gene_type:complete